MALTKVSYSDNEKLELGTGNDLQLYHDSNSYIKDVGDGYLQVSTNGSGIYFVKSDGSSLASFITDGSCELFEAGQKKLETESWGVSITGNLQGMTSTSSGEYQINSTTVLNASKSLYNIGTFACSGPATITGTEGVSASLYLIADEGDDDGDGWRINSNQDANDLTISNNESGSYVDKITITKTGEIGVNQAPDASGGLVQINNDHGYQDGGNSMATSGSKAALRIKTSNDSSKSLYIGGVDETAEPYLQVGNLTANGPTASYDLHLNKFGGSVKLYSGGATDPQLQTTSTGIKVSGADSGDQIKIVASGTNANGVIDFESPGTGGGIIKTQGTTALTLDNSQNATFAKGVTIAGGAAGDNGLKVTGQYSSGNQVDIQIWERVGGAVAAKFQYRDASTDMYFGTTTAHSLNLMSNGIKAIEISSDGNTTFSNNAIFNAGYGCHFGASTGSGSTSTVLDDYEEGTFEIDLSGTGGSITEGSDNTLSYTKIGRQVFISGRIYISAISSPTGDLTISGLPFANQAASETAEKTYIAAIPHNWTYDADGLWWEIVAGASNGPIQRQKTGVIHGNKLAASAVIAGSYLIITGSYHASA